jgi:hypothetical protein
MDDYVGVGGRNAPPLAHRRLGVHNLEDLTFNARAVRHAGQGEAEGTAQQNPGDPDAKRFRKE